MNLVPERLYALARSQNAEKLWSWIWGAPRLSGAVLQKRMSGRWSSASLHAETGHHSVKPSSAPLRSADAGMIHTGSTSSEVNSQINSSRPCCLHILLIKQILAFYRLNAISNSSRMQNNDCLSILPSSISHDVPAFNSWHRKTSISSHAVAL